MGSTGAICPACNLLPPCAFSNKEMTASCEIDLRKVDLDALMTSSRCDFCLLLLDLHRHWTSEARDEKPEYAGITYRDICGHVEWRKQHLDTSKLGLLSDFDGLLAKRIDMYNISEEPLSNLSLRQVRHWMKKCERKHSRCFDHSSTLPTRVIDIQHDRMRLLDPSPIGNHQYVALSHCWGTCRTFLTTRNNLDERKAGFLFDELPVTFQDAVLLAQRLGFQYLWIDSVCILQGDKVDWETEGSRMADVYANASLCIAAGNANDDAEGFLKPRKLAKTLAVRITFTSPEPSKDVKEAKIYISGRSNVTNTYPPLEGRAWCLQEKYLSPRLLFVGWDMMSWECLENGWSEIGRGLMKPKPKLQDVMPENDMNKLLHTPWAKLLEYYTERAISFPGDKLPAISALAARVARDTGDEYLAGLWKSDLLRGLIWYRIVRRNFRFLEPRTPYQYERSSEYIAPTWSWASFSGAVQFEAANGTLHPLQSVRVVEARVHPSGQNLYGQVDSGFLRLLSPVLMLEVNEMAHKLSTGAWSDTALCVPQLDDNGFDVLVSSSFDYPSTPVEFILGIPLVFGVPSEDGESYIHPYDDRPQSELQPWAKVYGILITPRGNDRGVHERIGCFSIGPLQLSEFMACLRQSLIQECTLV